MSSTPDAPETPDSKPAPAKKKVSTQRRIISWVFILILLGVVLLEWRAKSSQAKTFDNLDAAREAAGRSGEVPFEDFKASMIQGSPSEELDESGAILKLYHYRWGGVFKTYHLRMLVDNDGQVIVFDTAAEGSAVSGMPRISKERMDAFVKGQKEHVKQKAAESAEAKASRDKQAAEEAAAAETKSEN